MSAAAELVLVLVAGERAPRWIDAARLGAPLDAGAPRRPSDEPATVHADDGRSEAPSAPQETDR